MNNALANFFLNRETPAARVNRAVAMRKVQMGDAAELTEEEKGALPTTPVDAPAFSITKVLTAGSVVVAPLGTLLANWIGDENFKLTPGYYVTLFIGLLGFLAIVAAADVVARALAAGAEAATAAAKATSDAEISAAKQKAEDARLRRDTENLILFPKPFAGSYVRASESADDPAETVTVKVIAATGGATTYFCTRRDRRSDGWKRRRSPCRDLNRIDSGLSHDPHENHRLLGGHDRAGR